MFTLDQPWILLALPLAYLVYRFVPATSGRSTSVRVPFFSDIAAQPITVGNSKRSRHPLLLLLLSLIWLLLIAAASEPKWVGDPIALPSSGRDLLLAVDLSDSMQIEDMRLQNEQVNRLIAVKVVLREFIQQREGDRLGLILFGSQAYLQAPLTFDRDTVKQLLMEAQIGFAGPKTAIGDAIGLAVKQLRNREGDRHVLILLTDGANTAGEVDPLTAAKLAADNQTVIYTIGVGADEMVTNGFFQQRVNPSVDLDEDTLRGIANATGGQYFRARNPQELLAIYKKLDELEPVEDEAKFFRPEKPLFYWPLGAAMGLAALAGLVAWRQRGYAEVVDA